MARGGARFEMKGFKECREALQELTARVQKNVGKRALKPAAEVIRAEVASRAKVSSRPGNPTRGSLKAAPEVVVSKAGKSGPKMAVLVDDIAAVPKEFGLSTRDYPAEPFFRPAIDAKSDEAARVFGQALKAEVEAAAAKVAKKV